MFTEQEIILSDKLCKMNEDFAYIINRYKEEQELMISCISNELRNSLTLINSTIQLMDKKNSQLQKIKYWNQISNDIDNLITMLNDLLDYNKYNQLSKENSDLYCIISNVIKNHEKEIKNINTSNNIPQNVRKYTKNYNCSKIKKQQNFTKVVKDAIETKNEDNNINVSYL